MWIAAVGAMGCWGCDGTNAPGTTAGAGAAADAGLPDGALGNPEAGPGATPETATETAPGTGSCDPPGTLAGHFYWDQDESDESAVIAAFDPAQDAPLARAELALISPEEELATTTCADGSFGFGAIDPGTYLVAPSFPAGAGCQTRNCARRMPAALRSGKLKIVTFGDSIAVVGDKPLFPARLATLLGALADVEEVNVAVAGSLATDWLPGGTYFEQKLLPALVGADLVLSTLGGNDLLNYTSNPALLNDLEAAVEGAKVFVIETVGHVLAIAGAIRAANPEADLVYCLYPNYGQAVNTYPWSLAGAVLGDQSLIDILQTARDAVPNDGSVLLADLFGAAEGLPLDDYLYDSLHFNAKGQVLYAETIFATLGGVLIGPSPLGPEGASPLGLEPAWGLIPAP